MKKNFVYFIIIALAITLVTSCASIRAANCTTNAAYANGVNDGRSGYNMQTNYAGICEQDQTAINDAYRAGYTSTLPNNSGNTYINNNIPQQQCINNMGNKICGYNCVQSMGNAQCASTPDQECLSDNFGNIECGYSCIKSFGKVKCAKKPNQDCVADNAGNIVCGKNCQVSFGQIKCQNKNRPAYCSDC